MSEEKSAITFIGDRPRQKVITLEWPVEYGGKTYETISIKRLTVREVSALVEAARVNPDAKVNFPMFVDAEGALVPEEVMDGLDDDDARRIEEAAADFLPQRFRPALPASVSPPADGAPISSTSAT